MSKVGAVPAQALGRPVRDLVALAEHQLLDVVAVLRKRSVERVVFLGSTCYYITLTLTLTLP